MTELIQFFIKEMGKWVFKLTCAGMVNILKYVPGAQGVDDADELKRKKMCEKSMAFNPYTLAYVLNCFKTKSPRICS